MGAGHALEPSAPTKVVVFQRNVRDGGTAALTPLRAAVAPGHLGRGAGLVDEDQLFGSGSGCCSNQARRRRATSGRCCSLACAVLLTGCGCRTVERTPTPCSAPLGRRAPAPDAPRSLTASGVRTFLDQGQDLWRVRLDPMRALVPALWPWLRAASLPPAPDPPKRRHSGARRARK